MGARALKAGASRGHALGAAIAVLLLLLPAACGSDDRQSGGDGLVVIASMSFLADVAQNVAGDRFEVRSLVPIDTDPHSFQPTPSDLREIAEADIVILNGGGVEGTLTATLVNAGDGPVQVIASRGLASRRPQPGEPTLGEDDTDPHFWLDPLLVVTYVENIRVAFSEADPAGAAAYEANAAAYVDQLEALDAEIRAQLGTLPVAHRKLVLNHASHGYYADAYGLEIVGTVIPSVGTGESPTARQLGELMRAISESGAQAVFVELGEDPKLAQQIAAETGIEVVDDLLDHSLTDPDGVAPSYIEMLRFDTDRIVEALR